MGFLSVFRNIAHAAETIDALAAPIVQKVNPLIGGLMVGAAQAAVGVEAAITAPGQGDVKAGIVANQTKVAIDAINAILVARGVKPLPADTGEVVAQQVGVLVGNMNAIKAAVVGATAAASNSAPGSTAPASGATVTEMPAPPETGAPAPPAAS